jgi:hypothetical protein
MTGRLDARDRLGHADRVPDFERAEFVPETPLVGTVDADHVIRHHTQHPGGIREIERVHGPQELARPVGFAEHGFDPRPSVLDVAVPAHALETDFRGRHMGQGLQVERPELALAVDHGFPVETGVGLVAQPALPDHPVEQRD